jgi:hypothetical protein
MNARTSRTKARSTLDQAYEALERYAPAQIMDMLRRIRHRRRRKARLAMAAALVGLGVLGPALPVAGVWMIPLGLLLIAEDVPRLQQAAAGLPLWLERQWLKLRSWWQRRFQFA